MDKGIIKSENEIQIMREAGEILANILTQLKNIIKPGIDVWELEKLFQKLAKENGVETSCKNYTSEGIFTPFPSGLCVSINKESVHCFPKKGVVLKEGDIISVDTVIKYKGLHADSALACGIGDISNEKKKLIKTSEKALYNAISKVKHNVRIGKISNALQKTVEREGFNVLKDFAGHGIGYKMHEWPEISCYGKKGEGPKLKKGMTICIESLVCSKDDTVLQTKGWETEMKEGLFCMFEHTILVTKSGYEILTSKKS